MVPPPETHETCTVFHRLGAQCREPAAYARRNGSKRALVPDITGFVEQKLNRGDIPGSAPAAPAPAPTPTAAPPALARA